MRFAYLKTPSAVVQNTMSPASSTTNFVKRSSSSARLRSVMSVHSANAPRNSLGAFALCTDITERKRAEEELRFTKFVVEEAGDIVFWTTADGVFKYANRMARETLGYSLDELRTMTITDIDPDIPQS